MFFVHPPRFLPAKGHKARALAIAFLCAAPFIIALIAISVAMNPENRVLGLVSYAWAGFGAAFGPVVSPCSGRE